MDHPDLIVANFMGNYIGLERVEQYRYCDLEENSNANCLP